jgi:hypothetical protein
VAFFPQQLPVLVLIRSSVSFPTLQQNVQSLVTSLDKVKDEITLLKQTRIPSDNDQFIAVMQVNVISLQWVCFLISLKPLAIFPNSSEKR